MVIGFLKNKIFPIKIKKFIPNILFLSYLIIAFAILMLCNAKSDTELQHGYLLIDLSNGGIVMQADCPDGMVARLPDALWYSLTIDGVYYPDGSLYLPPGQKLIRVRTEGWKPPAECGVAYK